MTMRWAWVAWMAFAACALLAAGQAPTRSAPHAKQNNTVSSTKQGTERGQWVFEHNCMRCHTSPDGLSPHIAQTVAMHMRVRANLSEADYKELMRFLNP